MKKLLLLICFGIILFEACKKDEEDTNANYFIDTRDNTKYKTVDIGNQTWMAENLKYTGGGIALGDAYGPVSNDTTPLLLFAYEDDIEYFKTYGCLYTWPAAKKACPDGWRLPTDNDWKELEKTLGMTDTEINKNLAWRGTNQGTQLKENGSSGFNALMSGVRSNFGGYALNQKGTTFWTSTEVTPTTAYHRTLYSNETGIHRGDAFKGDGVSVRCIKIKP